MGSKTIAVFHAGYAQNCKDAVLSPATGQQLRVFRAVLENNSGGAINVALLKKLDPTGFDFLTYVALSTPKAATNLTLKAGTATGIVTTTNNDGYIVQSPQRFNLVGLNISTAAAGGSPVYSYTYWNGSSWANLTLISTPAYGSTGNQLLLFYAPHDWAVGGASGDGVDATKYAVRVRATTAPSGTAAAADTIWIGSMIDYQASLADKGRFDVAIPQEKPLLFQAGEGVLPYFAGTANAANSIFIHREITN